MKYNLLILFIALSLYSCDKEEVINQKYYPLNFKLINNGDNELYEMDLYSCIYFPEEDETYMSDKIKSKKLNILDNSYLHSTDSISYTPNLLGYKGCFIYVLFRFYFIDSAKNETVYKYVFNDTISDLKIDSITFIWPNDSSNFTRLE